MPAQRSLPLCLASPAPPPAQVVLASAGETATSVQVYRHDFYCPSGPAPSSSGPAAASASSSSEAEEALGVRDWVVGSQVLTAAAAPSCHQSAAGFGDQLLLLNSQGVRVVQLLSWQQRLSALASQPHQLVPALLAAVRIYQTAASAGGGGQQHGAAWPADGRGAALPEVQRQLLTILCAYSDQALALQGAAGGAATEAEAASAAADTAIGCCLLVRRPDALWSDLFPRFQGAGAAAPFLRQLLPFILSDQLPSVAPEVRIAGQLGAASAGRGWLAGWWCDSSWAWGAGA